jgi:hypothetical protein
MDDIETVTFDPWPDPAIDPYDQDPNGDFSRLAWLPLIGPSSWLIWGTLSAQLRRQPDVAWTVTDLGAAHGLHGSTSRNGPTRRTLARLCQFRMLTDLTEDHFLVRMSAPPLGRRHLERLPDFVVGLQSEIFRSSTREAG